MDKWNEICFIIKQHNKENTRESYFQNEVVNIFEKLGWSRYRNEIETEKNIPIGAVKDLRLDILISFEGEKFLPVELKRATNPGSERISRQLISYMLQERLKFGLFIGENMQLFYDVPNDNKHPIKLIEIEFSENNAEGLRLIEILKRDNFNELKFIEYCNEKLLKIDEEKLKKELMEFLISSEGNEYVMQLIIKDFKNKHASSIIDELESKISIKISDKTTLPQIEHFDFSRKKERLAISNFNSVELNGKLPIGKYVRETLNDLVNNNLIGNAEIEKLQRSDYSKQTFDIQFPFLKKMIYQNTDAGLRYWKNPIIINNSSYFVCSQWYEVPANNDRPFYENWLKKMKNKS